MNPATLTITIKCRPKDGKADKLHAALWAVVEKHTKRRKPQSIQTDYHYEEATQ